MSLDLRTIVKANAEDSSLIEGSFNLDYNGNGADGGKRFL
jgi:hypothetical protein